MTRDEKIKKINEILLDAICREVTAKTADRIIDALTDPELGTYGRGEDGRSIWYGRLTGIRPGARYPFHVGYIGSISFTPIPGLKEFLEEAER